MSRDVIRITGATQNNLKNLDLEIPLGELVVITGVSGSGKSSLAFDTIYSEGQRRYVETFSPYARQFLDRMDKPRVERIEGIPPAIAIDQTNPVRTSRSTVGTMTELNDHLKLLFSRAAHLHCDQCGARVERDDPESIATKLLDKSNRLLSMGERMLVSFTVRIPDNFSQEEVKQLLQRQGYLRFLAESDDAFEVIQDRLRLTQSNRARLVEALEGALTHGNGVVAVRGLGEDGIQCSELTTPHYFSSAFHCASCDRRFREPIPSLFSFNSPMGACGTCRGFGRTMGIDYGLVIPDEGKSLAEGAIKPWQSDAYRGWQRDMLRHAKAAGIATRTPWREMESAQKDWVIDGVGSLRSKQWYGLRRFFDWLERKSYRMHIRVLLSRYRSFDQCEACGGARLAQQSLLWRIGDARLADRCLPVTQRFAPPHLRLQASTFKRLPGLGLHDMVSMPLSSCRQFFDELRLPGAHDEAMAVLLDGIRSRLNYLVKVGLGYLTLDRQSRSLSGGEVQRINLTTALGTSLVNTLFVLDEPSIGLHARDMKRVVEILHRLRDAGNSLIVVEHDAEIMRNADRIIDVGPGPGTRGGEIVFNGRPAALLRQRRSLTGQYLSGERTVTDPDRRPPIMIHDGAPTLEVIGARANNLKDIDVAIPLSGLICITGVSGSGKSTLVEDVLYRGLRKLKGQGGETPGEHLTLRGHELIDDVILVDQTPIGKTTRSNPASYIGVLGPVRKLFAAEVLSIERGYTAGTFSFNAGNGRCPTCGGNGFEHVEMQFLSDVYLRCPDCDGTRYRPEVLDVRLAPGQPAKGTGAGSGRPLSIADELELTANEALEFFVGNREVHAALATLVRVGLGYLKLGQPVPTLSGGESQRLKLAGYLAKNKGTKRAKDARRQLYLFDEPTTGLHFEDVAVLIRAFDELVAEGGALVVIEHNVDVIAAADWVIDLGPEGGDGGGNLVGAGPPEAIAALGRSHTGQALAQRLAAVSVLPHVGEAKAHVTVAKAKRAIEVRNAREHNLKNVDISVPRGKFTVISGVSGSGKSTVAFDVLFNEGQRRYLESLNAYARQFVQPAARPEVDAIFGIPPTVAIEQRTSRGGQKSTVATLTEVYHFLRLLFVKLGIQHCPDCGTAISPQSEDAIAAQILRRYKGKSVTLLSPLIVSRKGYYTDLAKWANRKGYSSLRVDGEYLDTDNWPRLDRFKEHDIDLPVAEIDIRPDNETGLRKALAQGLALGQGMVKVVTAHKRGKHGDEHLFSVKRSCPTCERNFPELDPRQFSFNSKHGWCRSCFGTGRRLTGFDAEQTGEEEGWLENWSDARGPCTSCDGKRLHPTSLAVRLHGHSIADLTALPVSQATIACKRLQLGKRGKAIARDVLTELFSRLEFLEQVGLGYLGLDRAAPTLSGGEAQRIRLAAQLGSNLRGVCYILDEPTIGLHTRDNGMLLDTLKSLRAKGNTVVVVEHDEETIRAADYVIDLGPGAGINGGQVVARGSVGKLQRSTQSLTGKALREPLRHPLFQRRTSSESTGVIEIQGAVLNNLRQVDATFPLGQLVGVSGVSGSGKSSLVRGVLSANLAQYTDRKGRKASPPPIGCKSFSGFEPVGRVLEVDQTPIGKTPRSCPATYIGIWGHIRRIFADTSEARLRGHGAGRFSFNVKGGRCEACEGQGLMRLEMSFLPDVRLPCDVCGSSRFNQETLQIKYRERSIAEILTMSVDDAVDFFIAHKRVHKALSLLQDVGLGYLRLGQPSPTLSGGEAQRIKLVTELTKAREPAEAPRSDKPNNTGANHTLYVLDEPTIGLHMADVEKLLRVLHRLVNAGNSVIVIEHNLDVIAEADHLIDMGPEGGAEGGLIVATGTPESVARQRRKRHTGAALAAFLKHRAA